MRKIYSCVLGLGLLCAMPVQAQTTHRPITPVQPIGAVDFESLFELDENGEPVVIVGSTDQAALERNTLISAEERADLEASIQAWIARVERTVVENIDLAVDLDTKLLKTFDMSDQQRLIYVGDAVNMLNSAGSLTDHLYEDGLLSDQQMQQNRRIVSDYQRGLMMYTGEMAQKNHGDDPDKQMAAVMESNYRVALRDPFWAYNRIIEALARHPEAVPGALSEQVRHDLEPHLERLSGGNAVDAVRVLLTKLSYEDQRALAKLGLELDKADRN